MKLNPLGVVVVVLVFVLGWVSWSSFSESHKWKSAAAASWDGKAAAQCVAAADEQCPTQGFLDEALQWKRMRDQLEKENNSPEMLKVKQLSDQLTGMGERLSKEFPAGYNWDINKNKFVKIPAPTYPPAPLVSPWTPPKK